VTSVKCLYAEPQLAATLERIKNLFNEIVKESQQLAAGANQQKTDELVKREQSDDELLANFVTDTERIAEQAKTITELRNAVSS
jgi:cell division protein FtsB